MVNQHLQQLFPDEGKANQPRGRRSGSLCQANNLRSAEMLATGEKNLESLVEKRADDYQQGFGTSCGSRDGSKFTNPLAQVVAG